MVALAVGVIAVSTSGPLIAFAAAPALTIAFWRNMLALPLLVPVAAVRRLSGWTWLGIGVAVVGAIALTGADLGTSGTALLGDVLALAGGLFGAVYTTLGERVRVSISTTTYTTVCYAVCALAVLAVCLTARIPLTGFPTSAWVAIVALTIGPQLLGHSLFSYSLRRISATTVSVVILLEVPGAALVAWAWLGQVPALASLPGLGLLLLGVAIVAVKDREVADAATIET